MKYLNFFAVALLALLMAACVPQKQFSDIKQKALSLEDNNQLLKEENRELTVQLNELDGKFSTLERKYFELESAAKKLRDQNEDLLLKNERLNKNQDELERQIDALRQGSTVEISKLMQELQALQSDLQNREDRVRLAEEQLQKQEQALKTAQENLAQQQARLQELQKALDEQKAAVTSLKDKLNSALRGFYDQGLSVYEKNGKVYVSLEEQLLFKTGSYSLDPKGQEALKSLGEVLASNPEINILVEGHTDNVPLSGSQQIKDNWDLSVMRATAVTKIILNNVKIAPSRITASGRGEYVPLDPANTPEARRKNRRTEIILTPDLSEVLEIIGSN
ncbi:MAG: OmpA family protein [Prolixibacteraceae bacterium]|nr:OmpA family protein [Prolixibacteraceae bacterium]